MKAKKLYEVEIRATMMVLAESPENAMNIAEYHSEEVDLEADFPTEFRYKEQLLPIGWNDDCLVYQEDDTEVRVGDIRRTLSSKDQLKLDLEKS